MKSKHKKSLLPKRYMRPVLFVTAIMLWGGIVVITGAYSSQPAYVAGVDPLTKAQNFIYKTPEKEIFLVFNIFGVAVVLVLFVACLKLIRRHAGFNGKTSFTDMYVNGHVVKRKKRAAQNTVPRFKPLASDIAPPATHIPLAPHIPDWQAQIQSELKRKAQAAKDNNDEPKDMFEAAEEQYHYDEKLKKPPKKDDSHKYLY